MSAKTTAEIKRRAKNIARIRKAREMRRTELLVTGCLQFELSEMATILKAEAIHAKRSKRGGVRSER